MSYRGDLPSWKVVDLTETLKRKIGGRIGNQYGEGPGYHVCLHCFPNIFVNDNYWLCLTIDSMDKIWNSDNSINSANTVNSSVKAVNSVNAVNSVSQSPNKSQGVLQGVSYVRDIPRESKTIQRIPGSPRQYTESQRAQEIPAPDSHRQPQRVPKGVSDSTRQFQRVPDSPRESQGIPDYPRARQS